MALSYACKPSSRKTGVAIKTLQKNHRAPITYSKTVLASLLTLVFCSTANAQNNETAQLRNEVHALKEQLQVVEAKLAKKPHHTHHTSEVVSSSHQEHSTLSWSDDKKIHFKGITLTPGGFLAGEGLWRSRNEQSDIGSTFSGIPLGNSALYNMHEFRLSARQSRISLLIEGPVNPNTLISGYYEADFLGNGSGNSNESNSFDLRVRHLYATVDRTNWGPSCDWGTHLLAGQNWSLVTTNTKGITPRNEATPPTIDAQYVVGFAWKRQAQLRLTQNFGPSFWAAVSIENAQNTFGGTACGVALPGGITNQVCSAPGTQTLPSATIFSINNAPDVVAKLAYESKIRNHNFHAEVFGLFRNFYDRVQRAADHDNNNKNTSGAGVGGGTVIEVVSGMLDFQGNILAGRGIGSYATGSLPDVTIGGNGQLVPIHEVAFMVGATLHATPLLDLYVFGGQEKQSRKYFANGATFLGYGVPNANNTGCSDENGGICAGNTSSLRQITVGLWGKPYKGAYGELRTGLQYSYTKRDLFSGSGGGAPAPLGYSTNDNMVFGSIRYYPFT